MIELYALYRLFNINVSNALMDTIIKISEKDIPQNIFGVFFTVYRNQSTTNTHNNVYSCTGRWDNKYSAIKSSDIIAYIGDLAENSHSNSRAKRFNKPLMEDAESSIEISFMLKDIEPVNMNEKEFDNEKYGIIVDYNNGTKRATFLPEVFGKISWNEIRTNLIDKADITPNENEKSGDLIKFYKYETKTIGNNIYDLLFSNISIEYLQYDVYKFYWDNYKTFIPYSVSENGIIIDKTEAVRNISCICDVIQFGRIYDITDKLPIINENLNYYYGLFKQSPEEYRQAAIFLVFAFYLLGKPTKDITKYLWDNIDKMDRQFELGEALSVLHVIEPKTNKLNKIAAMYYNSQYSNDINNVFELNWVAKFARVSNNVDLLEKIGNNIIQIINKIKQLNELETNYLAVMFECLTSLDGLDNIELCNKRMKLFILLNERRMNGLYYFRDMKEARLDITGHILML